ncbi:MAG: PAS domain S-box protein [Balneolales bacterium]
MNNITPNCSSLFYFNPLPTWVYDLKTFQIWNVNQAAIAHYGYSEKEFLSLTLKDLRPEPEIPNLLNAHIDIDYQDGNIFFGVFTHQKKSGELIRMEINGHKVDYLGKQCMMVICKDVTEEEQQVQQLKESEERLKATLSIAKLGYWRLEMDGDTLSWTDDVYRIWGRRRDDFELNLENFLKTIHPDDREAYDEEQQASFAGDKEHNIEHRIILPDGSIRWVHELGRLVTDDHGNPVVFEGTVQDITSQKEEEQRLKLLESVITHTNDAIVITEAEPQDEPGPRIIYVNEAFTKMTGYTPEEVIGKTPRILQGPNSDEKELARLGKALRNWEPCEITTINYKKNGEEFWINFSVTPAANEKGWYTHWIAIERDVTEQKQKALEKELLDTISLNFSVENDLLTSSNAVCKTIREFGGFDFTEIWLPNLENTHVQLVASEPSTAEPETFYEWSKEIKSFELAEGLPGRVWEKKSSVLWKNISKKDDFFRKEAAEKACIESALGIPLLFNEKIVGVLAVGTQHDISYLQQYVKLFEQMEHFIGSEINRKKLENDLSHLYDAIPDILCMADFQGRFLKINKAGCELLGYSEDEIVSHTFDEFVHPEDKDISTNVVANLSEGESAFNFENRYLTKNGTIIWLSWTCNSAVEEGIIYATARNITEEKKLRELNRQAGSLAKIGSWEVDLINSTAYWSDITHQLHETDPKSFFPGLKESLNFYREDFRPMINSLIEKSIITGETFDYEAVLVTAKNNERWVRVLGNAELVDGQCRRIYGSFQDINKRKTAELAVLESEAKFKTIFEIASLGIIQVDPLNGRIILANSYYETITGYTNDELLKLSFLELTHPDDREKDWVLFSKAAEGEGEYINEKRYVKKDGIIGWVRLHVAFIRDESGKPIKTVAICEDITDRKETEVRLQNLSDNIPGIVFQYLLHPDGTDELRHVSKGSEKIWGYSPEAVTDNIDLVWNQTKAGGDFEEVQQSIIESIENKSQWSIRYRTVTPDGQKRILQGLGTPQFLGDGTVIYNSVVLNITQEARNEELLELATDLAKIGSWEIDLAGKKIIWSDMVHELHETDSKSFVPDPETAINFYREDFREMVDSEVAKCIETGVGFDFEAVIITAKKQERWIRSIGNAEMVDGKCERIYGSFQDINLSKSLELQIRDILESISDAFYGIDEDWNFTYFNGEAENLLKRKSEDVLGKNIWEVFSPAKGTVIEEKYRNVAKTGKSETFEYWYPGDGSWYEINAYSSKGGVSAFFKNIDDRRKAEEELKKAYKEKNNILESIGDAFFAVNKDWIVTYWNKEAEIVLGRKRTEIVGENLWEIYTDTIDTDFYRQYHKALETGENVSFEEYYVTLNKWFEVSAYPSQEGLSVYFKDVTLRKEAALHLTQANERFEKVTEATNDAIWDYDVLNNDLFWGRGFQTLFGYSTDDIKPSFDLLVSYIHADDRERIVNKVSQYMQDAKQKNWYEEYQFQRADGSFAFVIDRATFLRNNQGKIIRVIGAMTDVTEQKNYEAQLLALNKSLQSYSKELERSNEELEQFAFITSHDLQEPLRMISSFMDQLKRKYKDQLDDKALQYIHFATDGAKRMKQVILDLLEYSRAGQSTDSTEKINMNAVLEEYQLLRRKLIAEKSVDIKVSELPVVHSYKAPLTQTLHCLIDNAIYYSREGIPPHIDISVEKRGDDWKFRIQDNGIGIDPKFFEKIFIIFQRLHNRDQYEGTGIGLSIAKKHVESWGGEIWLESIPGKGTTFYFTVPKTNELALRNINI